MKPKEVLLRSKNFLGTINRKKTQEEYKTRLMDKLWKTYGRTRIKLTDLRILPGNLDMAMQYAAAVHRGIKRRSGLPYLTHPAAVLAILIDHKINDRTLHVAAVLHDVIEERVMQLEKKAKKGRRKITATDKAETMAHEYEYIRKKFGKPVADLVLEVSKDPETGKFHLKTAAGMIIKMADRTHNLTYFESTKRQKEYVDKTSQLIHDYGKAFEKAHPQLYRTLRRQHKTRAQEIGLEDLAGWGKDYDEPEEKE